MKTLHILHLEDNSKDAELVREVLSENQVTNHIVCVQTREDFQRELDKGGLDLIISDYALPSFDGISALSLARQKCPEVPFIFVSGNIGEEKAIDALKNGATDYILKDRLLRLVSSVRRALREAEMKKENQQLEEQFRQSQKMEVIGRLAGGIAHDFNNMLTIILGHLEMLIQDFQSEEAVVKRLEEIRGAAEKSSALTQQLLAFSRRQVLQPKVVDLNVVISSSYQMFRRIIGEDTQLITSFAENLGRVKVDPAQFEQILLNLLINARDAMPGGGRITLETKNVTVDGEEAAKHPGLKAGKYVSVFVEDTGSGMTDEIKAKIFEPFFTTKDPGKGTGLGLATVFGIVKQSHGYIDVESQPGRGSAFKIYLPEVYEKITPEEKTRLAPAKKGGAEIILLVEDEPAVRVLTRKILEMKGYTVLEADGGEKAISICQSYKGTIHLLLTDSVMPRMSGQHLSQKLTVMRPMMKVIYVSGYADEELNEERIIGDGVAFIQKPFTPDTLTRRVREMLDN